MKLFIMLWQGQSRDHDAKVAIEAEVIFVVWCIRDGCNTTSLTGVLIAVSEPNGGHPPYNRYGNLVIKVLAISLLNTVNTRLATESYHSITESSHIVTLENIKIAYDNILSHLARVRLVACH